MSEETKKKISETLTGRNLTFSDTHRKRLSEVQKGKIRVSYLDVLKIRPTIPLFPLPIG